MSLQTDIINFSIIVDLANQYARAIKHDAKIRKDHNLYNKTRSIEDKCNWYLLQLKSSLEPASAVELDQFIKEADPMGVLELYEYAILLKEEDRNRLKSIIKTLEQQKTVEVKIVE